MYYNIIYCNMSYCCILNCTTLYCMMYCILYHTVLCIIPSSDHHYHHHQFDKINIFQFYYDHLPYNNYSIFLLTYRYCGCYQRMVPYLQDTRWKTREQIWFGREMYECGLCHENYWWDASRMVRIFFVVEIFLSILPV